MKERIAASRASTSRTGRGVAGGEQRRPGSSIGMRSASIAPNRLPAASASCPVSRSTSTTGDSGGMYQTMGMVRYSGCSGSATSNRLISAHTGERCAASTQSLRDARPFGRLDHLGVGRVEEHLAAGPRTDPSRR